MPHFKTIAEFEAQTAANAPTEAERQLIEDCCEGRPCILAPTRPETATPANIIRAPLLRLLIIGGSPACGLTESGVHLCGGFITGSLDLDFATARGMTTLDVCHFTDAPRLMQAHLRHLSLQRSHLPGLLAQGMTVDGSVLLRNLTATATVDVNGAQITGQLDCSSAEFDGQTGPDTWGRALHAQGVTVGAALFLRSLTATGMVDVNGARIGGQLACTDAKLDGKTGPDSWGVAFNAQGVTVGADLFLIDLTATGMVAVNGAQITGQLDCTGTRLDGRTGPDSWGAALNAQEVTIGAGLFLRNLIATGMVDVNGARISGELDCDGATFDGKSSFAFNGQRMQVKQGFLWRGIAKTAGQVSLASAHVGDLVDDLASWPDDLYLDGFTYDRISAAPTEAKGRLGWLKKGSNFQGTFHPQPYTQLAKVLFEIGHDREARVVLRKREALLHVHGRAARRIEPNGDVDVALRSLWRDAVNLLDWLWDWLTYLVIGYGYRPFNSLAALLFLFVIASFLASETWSEGSFAPNSDVILTSSGWAQAEASDCIPRQDPPRVTICDPNPAAAWASDPARGLDWDTFNPWAYAADLVVPVLDIGQTSAWAPSKDRGPWGWGLWWGRWVLEVLGWVITALGAAAITGIIQRDRG